MSDTVPKFKKKTRSKAEVREKLLDALEGIIDDEGTSTASKIRAIEVFGREFGVFIEQKKVQIDVNTVVRHLTDSQIYALVKGEGDGRKLLEEKRGVGGVDYLDIDARIIPPDDGVLDGVDGEADRGSGGPRGENPGDRGGGDPNEVGNDPEGS